MHADVIARMSDASDRRRVVLEEGLVDVSWVEDVEEGEENATQRRLALLEKSCKCNKHTK